MGVNSGPVEFTVVKGKEQMTLVRTFTRTTPGSEASAEYRLNVTACNPAC